MTIEKKESLKTRPKRIAGGANWGAKKKVTFL